MRGDELIDFHHFGGVNKRTLHTHGVVALQIEHVTSTNELIGTHTVEDGLRVDTLAHLKGDTAREVGLDSTSDDVCGRTLGGNDHVDTYGTCFLGDTGNRQLNLLTCRHNQITILIDDHHDIRHKAMTILRVEFTLLELLVIVFDVTLTGSHQQLVTGVHLHTKRIQGAYHLRGVGDNRTVHLFRKGCKEMTLDSLIDTELYHLRIDEHNLHLCRMLLI